MLVIPGPIYRPTMPIRQDVLADLSANRNQTVNILLTLPILLLQNEMGHREINPITIQQPYVSSSLPLSAPPHHSSHLAPFLKLLSILPFKGRFGATISLLVVILVACMHFIMFMSI